MRVQRSTVIFGMIASVIAVWILMWVALFPPQEKPKQIITSEYPKVYMILLQRGPEHFEKTEGGYVAIDQSGTEMFLPVEDTYVELMDDMPGIDSYIMADEDETGTTYNVHLKESEYGEMRYTNGKAGELSREL